MIMPAFGVEGEAYLWLLTGFAVVLGPNLFSVPFIKRTIFARWRQIALAVKIHPTTTNFQSCGLLKYKINGMISTMQIDPNDTYFEMIVMIKNTAAQINPSCQ